MEKLLVSQSGGTGGRQTVVVTSPQAKYSSGTSTPTVVPSVAQGTYVRLHILSSALTRYEVNACYIPPAYGVLLYFFCSNSSTC